jgi:hypothetical protein
MSSSAAGYSSIIEEAVHQLYEGQEDDNDPLTDLAALRKE